MFSTSPLIRLIRKPTVDDGKDERKEGKKEVGVQPVQGHFDLKAGV